MESNTSMSGGQQLYKSTLENMTEGCLIIGFDWRYIFVNQVAASRLNMSVEQMIGK